jgi:hypothetical protein
MTGTLPSSIGQLVALTDLYIVMLVCSAFELLTLAFSQWLEQLSIDRHNTVNYRAIDSTRLHVPCDVPLWVPHHQSSCSHSGLEKNQLSGPLPSTIGRLTKLQTLYVDRVVGTESFCNSPCLVAQGCEWQPIDRNNIPRYWWAIDGTHFLVSLVVVLMWLTTLGSPHHAFGSGC